MGSNPESMSALACSRQIENAPGADSFQEADFSLVIAWSAFLFNRATLRLSRIKAYSTRQENVYRRSVVGIPSEVAP